MEKKDGEKAKNTSTKENEIDINLKSGEKQNYNFDLNFMINDYLQENNNIIKLNSNKVIDYSNYIIKDIKQTKNDSLKDKNVIFTNKNQIEDFESPNLTQNNFRYCKLYNELMKENIDNNSIQQKIIKIDLNENKIFKNRVNSHYKKNSFKQNLSFPSLSNKNNNNSNGKILNNKKIIRNNIISPLKKIQNNSVKNIPKSTKNSYNLKSNEFASFRDNKNNENISQSYSNLLSFKNYKIPPIYEKLYKQDKEYRDKKEKLINEKLKKEKKKFLKICTFKPDIFDNSSFRKAFKNTNKPKGYDTHTTKIRKAYVKAIEKKKLETK